MKIKVTRPDGSVYEYEGTPAELAPFWPRPDPLHVHPCGPVWVVPTVYPPLPQWPWAPYEIVSTADSVGTFIADPSPSTPTFTLTGHAGQS